MRISLAHVQQWLQACDAVPTVIRAFAQTDTHLPVCSLRIETEAVDCAFEQVWQVGEGEESELQRC